MNISIAINNYNYGRFLEDAIDSCLKQKRVTEIICIDDGSSDESERIYRQYKNCENFRVVRKENAGQLDCLIRGIAEASGEILCFLDADDRLMEHHVTVFEEIFSNKKIGVAWSGHTNSDKSPVKDDGMKCGIVGPGSMLTYSTRSKPRTITSCICIRREAFLFLEELPREIRSEFVTRADDCILLCGGLTGKLRYKSEQITVDRRVHGNNAFIHTGVHREVYEKYRHTLAEWRFIKWCAERLRLPEPSHDLIKKEERSWPMLDKKTKARYSSALRKLGHRGRVASMFPR